MTRPVDSFDPGGYAEDIDVEESALDAVVALLGLTCAEQSRTAREQICTALEDFKTARNTTAKVRPVGEDLRDLEELATLADPGRMTEPMTHAINALESLPEDNPVLHHRLKSRTSGRELRALIDSLDHQVEAVIVIARDIAHEISELAEEIRPEKGSGRPTDWAARRLASSLSGIWIEFAGRPMTRNNASDRAKYPFGDFVEAAGQLIDPKFKGHHHAREIRNARMQPTGGDN